MVYEGQRIRQRARKAEKHFSRKSRTLNVHTPVIRELIFPCPILSLEYCALFKIEM